MLGFPLGFSNLYHRADSMVNNYVLYAEKTDSTLTSFFIGFSFSTACSIGGN